MAIFCAACGGALAQDQTIDVSVGGLVLAVPIVDYLVLDIEVDGDIVPIDFDPDPRARERREAFIAKIRSARPGALPVRQIGFQFYMAAGECTGTGYLFEGCRSIDNSGPVQFTQYVVRPTKMPTIGTQMLRPKDLDPASVEGQVVVHSETGWTYVETFHDGQRLGTSCWPSDQPPWSLTCRHGATLDGTMFYQVDFSVRDGVPEGIAGLMLGARTMALSLLKPGAN